MFLRNLIPKYSLPIIALFVFVKILQHFPSFIEFYYSNWTYNSISMFFRLLFGWVPMSIGDLFYILVILIVLFKILAIIILILKKNYNLEIFFKNLRNVGLYSITVYTFFHLLWGLNYYRQPIDLKLRLPIADTSKKHLVELTSKLLILTNQWKPHQNTSINFSNVKNEAIEGYRKLSLDYTFINYSSPAVKASLFGVLGNYMGYSGYFNPFSAEAQINTSMPDFIIPFVTCHEIAHQLGYAKENEASFIGFLAAKNSNDSALRYSTYVQMFLYANGEFRRSDSVLFRNNFQALAEPIKKDIKDYRKFLNKYQSPLDQFVTAFYEQYLHINQQPEGHKSYNKVILWLLAYDQKFGVL